MTEIPIISQHTLSTLFNSVEANKKTYFADGWANFLDGSLTYLNKTSINNNLSVNLRWDPNMREGELDAVNSKVLYTSLKGITPYQARDERILAALSHLHAREYAVKRHKIKDNNTDKIKLHFFARGNGSRSIERDNAVGRLWWNGYVIARCKGSEDFDELLTILCEDTDFRSQLIERPSAATVPQAALAILMCKKNLNEQEPDNSFFKGRASDTPFRKWFRKINLYGGSKLFASMEYEKLYDLFWGSMMDINDAR